MTNSAAEAQAIETVDALFDTPFQEKAEAAT
jgi:hypothetical protein